MTYELITARAARDRAPASAGSGAPRGFAAWGEGARAPSVQQPSGAPRGFAAWGEGARAPSVQQPSGAPRGFAAWGEGARAPSWK